MPAAARDRDDSTKNGSPNQAMRSWVPREGGQLRQRAPHELDPEVARHTAITPAMATSFPRRRRRRYLHA